MGETLRSGAELRVAMPDGSVGFEEPPQVGRDD
jgi:hypothetical protein